MVKDGQYSRYINTFDYSLEFIKLKDVYYKAYRKNSLCFSVNGKNYTNHLINITFKFNYKLYNLYRKNLYIHHNYSYNPSDLVDNIYIKDGIIMAIRIDNYVNENHICESDYFEFSTNAYHLKKQPPTLLSRVQLREYLYANGFKCNGIEFVRWKRSSGSSRVGKCMFIDKKLYNRMHKWELCGLKVRKGQKIDLAAFESYISLTCSAIIGQVAIQADEILVIDDYTSKFTEEAIAIEMDTENRLTSDPKEVEVQNSIWDGQSLLDSSLFQGIYKKKGMLVLRNRFFKTCGFNTNIQQWFRDNNITEVRQLSGKTLAKNISQIKMITTPSSVKYLKFGPLEKWLEYLEPDFGVVKYDKPPSFFRGKMVQCHYQLLNTLKFTYSEMDYFLNDSLEYIRLIENNPAVLRFHIGYQVSSPENIAYVSSNDMVYMMLGINQDFTKTRYYSEFRNTLVKALIKNLKRGHVLINGNYSTLFGNGLEMLQASAGLWDFSSKIGIGCVISNRFNPGVKLVASRSPHITMSNTYLSLNTYNAEYSKYFNITNEIICVNSIGENLLQRLSGCDYDSDCVLLTDNAILTSKAEEIANQFLVPVNLVSGQKMKRYYTDKQKADLDSKTSINKIGEIVNLSQELNSKFWDNKKYDMNLYYDICKLSVLSGLEIDSAKKEMPVSTTYEINKLKKRYSLNKKPYFFKTITRENGYKLNKNYKYVYFETSMDYLHRIINKFEKRKKPKDQYEPFYSMLKPFDLQLSGQHYNKRAEIVSAIREFNKDLIELYIKNNRVYATRLRDEFTDYIGAMKLTKGTIFLLFKLVDNAEYRDIRSVLLEVLFKTRNEEFISLLRDSVRIIPELKASLNGELEIYGNKYTA